MSADNPSYLSNLSRRQFIRGAAASSAVAFMPGCKFVAGSGSNTIPEPPNFPEGIELYQQGFINWAREIKIAGVWFSSPKSAADVVVLANWARQEGYRIRPFGTGHGFAPTLLPRGHNGENVLLVNTHDYLHELKVENSGGIASVTAGAGAYIEDICRELEAYDLGLYHTTAPGGISIAGALAMNAHGAAIPKRDETMEAGHSWGTLSNLVLELTAVIWDNSQQQYVLKSFQRDDLTIGPLLTCLGRAFITGVKLQVGPNVKIRCTSRADLKITELLALPEDQTEYSFASLSERFGTVDIIYYPFNPKETAWVKTWTVTPDKPETSREVFDPYNYVDLEMSPILADTLSSALRTLPRLAVPAYNRSSADGIARLINNNDPATQVNDLWGSAYTTTLYVEPLTPRKTVAAWGVIIARENLQRALGEFFEFFTSLIDDYKSRGLYPYTGPFELRAQGLDHAADVLIPNAVEPTLSGARPHPDHPEKDTIVWFALNNNVDQPLASEFNARLEQWFLANYQHYGLVRPEWTKGYAYTAGGIYGGAWTNDDLLLKVFPKTWRTGYPADADWDAAVAQLNSIDPHKVFSNAHLDKLFGEQG